MSAKFETEIQNVKMTIKIVGRSDRNAWEWGEAIARSLHGDLNTEDNATFGSIAVECVDAEYLKDKADGR